MTINAAAPDKSLTAVKPAASASSPRRASRQRIELRAKATRANDVYRNTFKSFPNAKAPSCKDAKFFYFCFPLRLCDFALNFLFFAFRLPFSLLRPHVREEDHVADRVFVC